VLLAVAVRRRRLDDDPVGAARMVVRTSSVALWSVLALGLAGGAMSWVLVRSPRALTSTGYGWTLLAKVAIVVLVLGVALYNRQRLVPAVTARLSPAGGADDGHRRGRRGAGDGETPWPSDRSRASAWRLVGSCARPLLVEVVGLALVVGLTGFLVSQQPAAEVAGMTGAFEATATLTDDLDVDLVVDPNRAGRNAIHVYVLDATGRPADGRRRPAARAALRPEDIGPFTIEPFFVGPGHWTATLDDLAFPGEWEVRVLAGIDRFTEADRRVPIVVNP
jgi:copper transport protein